MAGQGRRTFIWAIVALAASMAFVPSLLRTPPLGVGWLPILQGLACVSFVAGMAYLIFAATPSAPDDLAAPLPEPRRDIVPTALVDHAGETEIEIHVQQQVANSLRFSRTVGVIYFDLDCHERIRATSGLETADRACLEIAALLRSRVRAYDYVLRLDKDQLVVCLSQLREKSELTAVAERLADFLQQVRIVGLSGRIEPAIGNAIYPMCGYSGRELVEFAKASAMHQRAVIAGGPEHSGAQLEAAPRQARGVSAVGAKTGKPRAPRRRSALSLVDTGSSKG